MHQQRGCLLACILLHLFPHIVVCCCLSAACCTRIVNRLTKDTSDVDRQLAGNTGMAVRNMLQVISCIALVGWIAPLALPSMVAIMVGGWQPCTQSCLRPADRLPYSPPHHPQLAFWLLYQYYQVRNTSSAAHVQQPLATLIAYSQTCMSDRQRRPHCAKSSAWRRCRAPPCSHQSQRSSLAARRSRPSVAVHA